MSDTPTYASLLTQLFSGDADERLRVMRYLSDNAVAALALEHDVRVRLRDPFPGYRVIAAEAVFRFYRDRTSAIDTLASLLRLGDPHVSSAALEPIRSLGSAATPLLQLLARHTPVVLTHASADFVQWAGAAVIDSGAEGLDIWTELISLDTPSFVCSLLIGFAHAAPTVDYNLAPVTPLLRSLLTSTCPAAGAALWRVSWRVNRAWLASLQPDDRMLDVPGLRELLLEVLMEHLGRCPDLVPLVRDHLAALPEAGAASAVNRLARLGTRGWGVLIPMLNPSRSGERFPVPNSVRNYILWEVADYPRVLPLVQHHAHSAILGAGGTNTTELVPNAARVLGRLGAAAGTALPDLLNLVVRAPSMGEVVGTTLSALAPGYPNSTSAIVRTLHRLRAAPSFGSEQLAAFQALGQALAKLDLDAGPTLIENTAIHSQVPDLLLQQPAWQNAPPATRCRHAGILADRLAHPRPEVRLRAAGLLQHYHRELPSVWPALVAVLTGADEKVAQAVLPHFRHLDPVADAVVPELIALFREPTAVYAARAVVALWRLGRMPLVSEDLRVAVEGDSENGWGWAVLQGVIDRVATAHGLLRELNKVFAASPSAVAEKVDALLNPPESPEEQRFAACLPRAGELSGPECVLWDDIRPLVRDDGSDGPLLFLALMCVYGTAGFNTQKIWMIKGMRELTRAYLMEAKTTVERILHRLQLPGSALLIRQECVRDFFAGRTELPSEIVRLIEHPVSWYRWAGLELADAWGLTPQQVQLLTEDRVWDLNARVRERAIRLRRA